MEANTLDWSLLVVADSVTPGLSHSGREGHVLEAWYSMGCMQVIIQGGTRGQPRAAQHNKPGAGMRLSSLPMLTSSAQIHHLPLLLLPVPSLMPSYWTVPSEAGQPRSQICYQRRPGTSWIWGSHWQALSSCPRYTNKPQGSLQPCHMTLLEVSAQNEDKTCLQFLSMEFLQAPLSSHFTGSGTVVLSSACHLPLWTSLLLTVP